jgi:hypothetical protein
MLASSTTPSSAPLHHFACPSLTLCAALATTNFAPAEQQLRFSSTYQQLAALHAPDRHGTFHSCVSVIRLNSIMRRFFFDKSDFERELRTYEHPQLQSTMPPLHASCPNADGALRSASGWPFPPFLVLERGVSLQVLAHSGLF